VRRRQPVRDEGEVTSFERPEAKRHTERMPESGPSQRPHQLSHEMTRRLRQPRRLREQSVCDRPSRRPVRALGSSEAVSRPLAGRARPPPHDRRERGCPFTGTLFLPLIPENRRAEPAGQAAGSSRRGMVTGITRACEWAALRPPRTRSGRTTGGRGAASGRRIASPRSAAADSRRVRETGTAGRARRHAYDTLKAVVSMQKSVVPPPVSVSTPVHFSVTVLPA